MEQLSRLTPEELASAVKAMYEKNGPLCDSEGFYNHTGECWNNSLQMVFLNSDAIKEKVQRKLASEDIDPAEVETIFRPYVEESLEMLLQSKKQNMDDYNKNQLMLAYIGNIYSYLETVQKRFRRHYYAETLRLLIKDELCSLEDRKGLHALTKLKSISLLHRAKGREGTISGFLGQNIGKYDLENMRVAKVIQNLYKPGGAQSDKDNVYVIFQQFFDLPIAESFFNYKQSADGVKKVFPMFFLNARNTPFSLTENCVAIYAGYLMRENNGKETGHAVSFYTCGGREYYFNDNVGTIQFPWKLFFKHLNDEKNADIFRGESFFYTHPVDNSITLIPWKIYFDGVFSLTDKSGYSLFKTNSYPFLLRPMFELLESKNKTKTQLFFEIITYLWNGEMIKIQLPQNKLPDYKFESILHTNTGESITIQLQIEQPKNNLKTLVRFDLTEGGPANFVHGKQNELTGAFLGTRVRRTNAKVAQAILHDFLQKVKRKEANVDDFFYTDQYGDIYTALTYAIENQEVEIIEELIALGANINKRMSDGSSPLFLAATHNLPLKILNRLLGTGEMINDRNNRIGGYTPLIGTILFNDEPNLEIIQFLIEKGADINIASKRTDTTPIEYAAESFKKDDVVQLLEKYGAKSPTCPKKEDLLKIVDRDMFDTQLMSYIRNHKLIKARLLAKCYRELEIYDQLNFENKVGDTALKLAIKYEPDERLIYELIRHGADENYIDKMGLTPTHYAIQLGKSDAIEELVKQGIKFDLSAPGLGTPMEYAERLGNKEIIKLLQPEFENFKKRLQRKGTPFVPKPTKPVKQTPMSFTPRPVKKLTLGKAFDNTRRGGRRRNRKTHKRRN